VVAFGISLIILRYRIKGIYFALMTMAIAAVAEGLVINWDYLRGPSGILLPLSNSPQNMLFLKRYPYYYIVLGLLLFGVYISYLIKRSKLGYYLIAIREDEEAAEISGVPTSRCKILIMVISGFMTAMGGSFYAQFFLYIAPPIMLGFHSMLIMMIGTCVGGPGTIFGPVLGSLFLSFLDEFLRTLPLHSREILTIERMISAVVLLAVILYLPNGLITLIQRKKRRVGKVSN
jgi:branched-chain amino acid transport system permease protein